MLLLLNCLFVWFLWGVVCSFHFLFSLGRYLDTEMQEKIQYSNSYSLK